MLGFVLLSSSSIVLWLIPHRQLGNYLLTLPKYRARALTVKRTGVEVYYVDYGNCEEVQNSDVKELEEQFRLLPAQAVHCGIHGISGNKYGYLSSKLSHLGLPVLAYEVFTEISKV